MTKFLSTIGKIRLSKSINNVLYETFNACQKASFCGSLFNIYQTRQITSKSKGHIEFKISYDPNFSIQNEVDTNIELKDLELNIKGSNLVVNLTWLRDNCHCNQCTHQSSRQRLFTPTKFRRQIYDIVEIHLLEKTLSKNRRQSVWPSLDDGEDTLSVKWLDGHQSEYSFSWLSHVINLNQEKQLNISMPKVFYKYPEDDYYLPTKNNVTPTKYWNAPAIETLLKEVNYHDLVEGFVFSEDANFINANMIDSMSPNRSRALTSLSNQLVGLGLAKIVDVPQDRNRVLDVARSLAYERPTGYGVVFDVVVEPSEEINLAYSSLEFDLHSDLSYRETSPGVQLLHCIRNSTEGGLSYFSDSFLAARTLQIENPKLFDVLIQFPVTFAVRDPYRNVKFRRHHTMIKLDHEGTIIEVNYSPFTLPPIGHKDDVKLFYLALDKFTQLLHARENKYIVKMDPGELFIFHNRRVLHGRSAYNATTSSRFLQGCYMDWDEIRCLDEKLRSHWTSRK